jgi:hypothetical protein
VTLSNSFNRYDVVGEEIRGKHPQLQPTARIEAQSIFGQRSTISKKTKDISTNQTFIFLILI